MAQTSKTCAACLEVQEKIGKTDALGATSATCFAGLCDTAVPVRVGQKVVGFLQTGQVALHAPSAKRFSHVAEKLVNWGVNVDLRRLEEAYFHSKVLTPRQYSGIIRLLEIFASHLSAMGNQLLIQENAAESPFARHAKQFISEHHADQIGLDDLATALHMSTFYFCKMFKKASGMTFTDYLGRVRIEKAKVSLLDPHKRISEVAYEVGFGSLTHFNRMFHRLEGVSPSDYREKVSSPARSQARKQSRQKKRSS